MDEKMRWHSFATRDRIVGMAMRWEGNFRGPESEISRCTEQIEHHHSVEGRGNLSLRRFNRGQAGEWIPNILPAPLRGAMSGVQGYGNQKESQEQGQGPRTGTRTRTIANSKVGHELNYFSDDTEGVQEAQATPDEEDQEGETDLENEYSIHRDYQGHQDQFPSKGNHSIPRSRPRSASEPLAPQTFTTAGDGMAGRGRGRGGGGNMLKGATWEYDASIKLESKPTELFPSHPNLKRPAPISSKERREIDNYKTLQDQIHRGSLYTQPTKRDPNAPAKTFGEEQFNRQYGTNRKADMDPFNGVETYSMRYAPKQRDLPKLSDQSFNKNLFPQELWATLEGTEGQEVRNTINRAIQKKNALIPGSGTNGDDSSTQKTKLAMEKINNVAGDDDNEELDEELQDAEAADDAYDDDDLGDDYNAEGYFDDGEGDMEDEADGGDENY